MRGALGGARAQSVVAFGAFALGIWGMSAFQIGSSVVWFAVACACLAGAALTSGVACRGLLVAAMIAAGAGWTGARIYETGAGSLTRVVGAGERPMVMVEGVLERDARAEPADDDPLAPPGARNGSARLDLRLTRVRDDKGWRASAERAVVRVAGDADPAWTAGRTLRVSGRLSPTRARSNPGEPDWAALANQQRRVGTIFVPNGALIEPAQASGVVARARAAFLGVRGDLRRRALRVFDGAEGVPGRSLMRALVLGERDHDADEVFDSFRRTGIAHLMAISGFHLAALAWIVCAAVRLTGERGWVEPAVVACLVMAYVFVLPVRPSVMRAAAMVIALLLADALGRRYDRVAVLAWVGVGLLVWRPFDLFALGFQLTIGVTAFLLVLSERYRGEDRVLLGADRREGRLWRSSKRTAWAALGCWLVATPVIAMRTGMIAPAGPIATVICTPMVLVSLGVGYAGAIAAMVIPALSDEIGSVVVAFGSAIAWAVRALDGAPATALTIARPSALWAWCATVGLAWVGVRSGVRDARAWGVVLALGVWAGVEHALDHRGGPGVEIRVDMLDVGDGSCYLIRSGSGAALWDCGSMRASARERAIPDAVAALGPAHVRSAFVTHANLDHFNALPDACERLGIEVVYTTHAFLRAGESPLSAPGVLLERLRAQGVGVVALAAGDWFTFGRARGEVLWPPRDMPERGVLSANDTSLVVRFTVETGAGERSVVMTGDIQRDAIAGVTESGAFEGARADVLEVPHHGSVSASSKELVRRLDPRVVLQSTGARRAERGGWGELSSGRAWWVTPTHGAAHAEIRRDGTVRTGAVRAGDGAGVTGGGAGPAGG